MQIRHRLVVASELLSGVINEIKQYSQVFFDFEAKKEAKDMDCDEWTYVHDMLRFLSAKISAEFLLLVTLPPVEACCLLAAFSWVTLLLTTFELESHRLTSPEAFDLADVEVMVRRTEVKLLELELEAKVDLEAEMEVARLLTSMFPSPRSVSQCIQCRRADAAGSTHFQETLGSKI